MCKRELAFDAFPPDLPHALPELLVGHQCHHSTRQTVNVPLWHRGYKLYQSRFNANDPDFSGLIVKRDRGLPWIYAGLPLTFTGILWMLIVDPALARRRTRKREDELERKRGTRS